mgnify:FL=1
MRNTLLKKASEKKIENTDKLTSDEFRDTVKKAKEMWIEFIPKKHPCKIIAIDSSYAEKKYQGMKLYGIDVFASDENGEKVFEKSDVNIATGEEDKVASNAAMFEMIALENTVNKADFILVDGSVLSHNFRTKEDEEKIIPILENNSNIIFVAKTSNSRTYFDATFADVMYFNHASKKTGMTNILKTIGTRFTSKNITISYVYARLATDTQLLKIEMYGDGHTEEDFKRVIDHISYKSKHGYPYALKLAHNNCEIHVKDLDVIASDYGLRHEVGSREAVS